MIFSTGEINDKIKEAEKQQNKIIKWGYKIKRYINKCKIDVVSVKKKKKS